MKPQSQFTEAIRNSVNRMTVDVYNNWYKHTVQEGQACLYWMHATIVVMKRAGIPCEPMCGTAHIMRTFDPDPRQVEHWSYEWSNESVTRDHNLGGMHCWLWIPKVKEVVDMSVRSIVDALAKRGQAVNWNIPDYAWGTPSSLAPEFIYLPNRDATELAVNRINMSAY